MYGLFKGSTLSSSWSACRIALSVYPGEENRDVGSPLLSFPASSELWSLPGIGPHNGPVKGSVALVDNYAIRARPPSLAPRNVERGAVPCVDETLGGFARGGPVDYRAASLWSVVLVRRFRGCRYAADKWS
jgi:hypothetical protein